MVTSRENQGTLAGGGEKCRGVPKMKGELKSKGYRRCRACFSLLVKGQNEKKKKRSRLKRVDGGGGSSFWDRSRRLRDPWKKQTSSDWIGDWDAAWNQRSKPERMPIEPQAPHHGQTENWGGKSLGSKGGVKATLEEVAKRPNRKDA